jgi:hypothetical protein
MKLRQLMKATAGAVTIATCLAAFPACAAASTHLYVRVGPPAPIVEVRPARPGPEFVWVAGFHRWDGRAYVWTPGEWRRPPRARARWADGHWRHDRHGWYWVEGRWR